MAVGEMSRNRKEGRNNRYGVNLGKLGIKGWPGGTVGKES